MPHAHSSASSPSCSPSRAQACRAASMSSSMSPPRNRFRVEKPQYQQGIRDGRCRPSTAVAGRPRVRPGGLRPYPQHASGVDPRDRTAARADGLGLDHRQRGEEPGNLRARAAGRPLLGDDGDVERGAAHVAGDHVLPPRRLRDGHARSHARGRPRARECDGRVPRFRRSEHPAGRMHEIHGHAQPAFLEGGGQGIDTGNRRYRIGIQHRVRRALEFADGGRAFRSGDDRHPRERVANRFGGGQFVYRIAERPQERDRDRLALELVGEPPRRSNRGCRVEGRQHVTVAVDTLGNADDPGARDDGLGVDRPDPVVDTPALGGRQRVLEARCRDQPDAHACAGREDVGDGRRSEPEAADAGQHLRKAQPGAFGDETAGVQHRAAQVRRRRGDLRPPHRLPRSEDGIGEGSADVNAQIRLHGPSLW